MPRLLCDSRAVGGQQESTFIFLPLVLFQVASIQQKKTPSSWPVQLNVFLNSKHNSQVSFVFNSRRNSLPYQQKLNMINAKARCNENHESTLAVQFFFEFYQAIQKFNVNGQAARWYSWADPLKVTEHTPLTGCIINLNVLMPFLGAHSSLSTRQSLECIPRRRRKDKKRKVSPWCTRYLPRQL